MTVLHSIASLSSVSGPVHLAAGVFDGLHLGHQAVIGAAVDGARSSGGRSVVLTFDPHPAAVLRPGAAPALLVSSRRREQLLAALGVDALLLLPFNEDVAHGRARAFVESLVSACRPLRQIAVGWNWTFGHKREGDARLLGELGEAFGFEATVIAPVRHGEDGVIISSTAIRDAIRDGDVELASELLGRPHGIEGVVTPGRKLGRRIGFPTANLPMDDGVGVLLPPNGVYAIRARRNPGHHELCGVANLGVRPTIDAQGTLMLEAHLFDFDADLYGEEIRVQFLSRLRGEQKFDSLDALKAQISSDVAAARKLHAAAERLLPPA